ncbi:flagellar basal-body rod protein FlgG [Geomicrobium halophilum]|uniref:Flagellar basal-body rod protein FlgG n=1 Tax=Geomicrobium halophilum TaxID=549000 RepID=A0A841PZL4_9BACL|nr:flagellar hook-basal body protein [Geomicrobium halophilum]MBB6450443.1 flagellar basal-body rod protein FlgG [Geomicrobium halophilum]
MIRGFYQAASGMITQQRRTDMLGDNLSNMHTPGYKADQSSIRAFPNMLVQAMNTNGGRGHHRMIGELATGVYMQERSPNYTQGDLRETGVRTDVAILQGFLEPEEETGAPGMLFFAVIDEEGNMQYTRNGNFTVDGQGLLTNSQGHYILGVEGEPLDVGNEWFEMGATGEITDNTGDYVGQLEVVYAEGPQQLVKTGEGLLQNTAADDLVSVVGNDAYPYELQQQFLERSNVDVGQMMTNMTNAYRNFEANQTVLQAYDQNLQRTANDIGNIN